MGSGSACMERTGTSRSCPTSGPFRESAPRRHLSLSRFCSTSAHRPLLLPRLAWEQPREASRPDECFHAAMLPQPAIALATFRSATLNAQNQLLHDRNSCTLGKLEHPLKAASNCER
jgi:hypothetical protein